MARSTVEYDIVRRQLNDPAYMKAQLEDAHKEIAAKYRRRDQLATKDWVIVITLAVVVPAIVYFVMIADQLYVLD